MANDFWTRLLDVLVDCFIFSIVVIVGCYIFHMTSEGAVLYGLGTLIIIAHSDIKKGHSNDRT